METTQNLAKLALIGIVFLVGCGAPKKVSQQDNTSANIIQTESLSDEQKGKFEPLFLEALKQQSLGNYEAAEKLFSDALIIAPNQPACLFQYGKIKLALNQPDLALASFQKAAALDSKNKWYLDQLAQTYGQMGLYTHAAEIYDTLYHQHPNQVQFLFDCANNYLNAQEYKKAAEKYHLIQETVGYRYDISEQIFRLYVALGEDEKAIDEINKFNKSNTYSIKGLTLLANYYLDKKDLNKVIELYQQMIKIHPDDPLLLVSLSTYQYKNGSAEESFITLKKAFQNPKLDPETRITGISKVQEKVEYAEYIQGEIYGLIEVSLNYYPNNAKLLATLGDFYVIQEDYENAKAAYQKSLDASTDNYGVFIQLMLIQNQLNEVDNLEKTAQLAIESFPNQPVPYLFYGITLSTKENYADANKTFLKGSRLTVNNNQLLEEFYSNLGNTYYQLDDLQNAWRYYEKALRLNPNNDLILNNYAYQLSETGTELAKALEMIEKALAVQPNSAIYLDTYGWIMYQYKSYEEAKIALEKSIKNGGNEMSDVCLHLSKVYEALGDKTNADKWRKKAEELK